MFYEVTKQHPAPTTFHAARYPFRSMEVGESFDAPLEMHGLVKNAAVVWGRRNERKFSTRKVDGLTRCWRIA